MCGPAGSGKTTFARKLEAGGADRLSFDEESFKRGIFKHPLPDEIREAIKQELDARLLELIKSGQDVVLDYSFWSKEMRKEYTDLLKSNGIHPIIYYVECPKEIAMERLQKREGIHGGDIMLPAETASIYYDHFQEPEEHEGHIIRVKGY